MLKLSSELGVDQFVDQDRSYEVQDNHLPLNNAGIKSIDMIDLNYPDASNRFWHTTQDTPYRCGPESLATVGEVLMYVTYQYLA